MKRTLSIVLLIAACSGSNSARDFEGVDLAKFSPPVYAFSQGSMLLIDGTGDVWQGAHLALPQETGFHTTLDVFASDFAALPPQSESCAHPTGGMLAELKSDGTLTVWTVCGTADGQALEPYQDLLENFNSSMCTPSKCAAFPNPEW